MKQVIFDTDIGIDDAMALLFLHYSPDVNLLGIVTGFGNASVENTTRNALFLKEQFNIDAPVFRGAAEAIGERLGEGYPDFVHGSNGLGEIEFAEPGIEVESTAGAQGIVDLVTANPNELSIVAVGRMTNLALALELCPELPSLVKEVVIMGGAFGLNGHRGNVSPVAEANIAGDPQAADIVFTSGLPITIVGLDVTQESIASSHFFDQLRDDAGAAGELIYRFSRRYLEFHQERTGHYECSVHDSSAVAYLLNPDLFETEQAVVRVVTEGIAMGETIASSPGARYESNEWQDKPTVNICTSVDSDRLLDLYKSTLALASN
ncbi:MAG: nucleoside hydrolase [Gammaproteobacteria bacterium]|nr:MAG: nucleoside hydrolase [Gammaproteobacteria bacterium]